MKRVKFTLAIAAALLLVSCAPMAIRKDNVSITLPMMPSAQQASASRDAGQGETGCFIITVTDSAGATHTKNGRSGDTLTFDLPLGEARIDALAYADELQQIVSTLGASPSFETAKNCLLDHNVTFWFGTTNHTVTSGTQNVTLTMNIHQQQNGSVSLNVENAEGYLIITITDSTGITQTKRAQSGNAVTFNNLALGDATIDALAFTDEMQAYVSLLGTDAPIETTRTFLQKADTDFWSGTTNHTVVDGAQTVTLTLNKTAFVDKMYLANHEGISFYKEGNNNYTWSYPTYNLSGSEMLSAFCYDKNGNFITAKQNDSNGNNSRIEVYKPVSEGDSYIYSEDSKTVYTLADGVIPQRMTSSGNVIYFITNKYGARDDDNNTVWYFDDTGTPATVTPESFAVADFDIITALLYDHGTLYFAGEKRGQPTEIDFALNDDDYFGFPSTLYSSTYSVTQYLIKNDGTPDTSTKSTYLSYTDDDIIPKILSKVDEDDKEYIAVPYNDWDNKYKNIYLYNSISDLGVYDGKVCGITSSLLSPNDCYAGIRSSSSNHGDFAFGSVIYGANGEPEEIIGFDENTTYCRFVAIKPKELDLSYLVGDDNYGNYRNGIAKINFETETPSIEPDETLKNIDASRNGSGFNGLLSDRLSENGHLYACYFDQSNLVGQNVIWFGKSSENASYRWAYPEANLSSQQTGNQHDLSAFCYDYYGNFYAAQYNETESKIDVYIPQANGSHYSYYPAQPYMKTFILPPGIIPQRITSSDSYVYFITNKYGERDNGNNRVYYFDTSKCTAGQTITAELKDLSLEDFDIVTALTYKGGCLYVAGEKKGSEPISLPASPENWDFPTQGYQSTYSVICYPFGTEGSLDTNGEQLYFSYTDEDMLNRLDYNSPYQNYRDDYADLTDHLTQYYGNIYSYGSISDLIAFNNEVYAIRNMLILYNKCNNSSADNIVQDYIFGDIVTAGNNDNAYPLSDIQMYSPRDLQNSSRKDKSNCPVPCRFIAVLPSERQLLVSLLNDRKKSDSNGSIYNKEIARIDTGYTTYQFTAEETFDSDHLFDFISYRSGSFLAGFDESFNLFKNCIHLMKVIEPSS